jgi:hypothetical protein
MVLDDPREMLKRAPTCSRLAGQTDDPTEALKLRQIAEEYEAKAAGLLPSPSGAFFAEKNSIKKDKSPPALAHSQAALIRQAADQRRAGDARAHEERSMTVWIYINTAKELGDVLKVSAIEEAAERWFTENDPEGVAFEYPVCG